MTQKQEVIDYVEELSQALNVLSLDIERISNDLKKVQQTLSVLSQLKNNITDIESLAKQHKSSQVAPTSGNVIEGEFDGYFMLGDDSKKYPVPINYSSKSKLIPGDRLKVTIKNDGELIYKLIGPAERQHIRAVLLQDNKETTKYYALTQDKQSYILNTAAVTFFKGVPGDEAYITVNKSGKGNYAALEAIIKNDK